MTPESTFCQENPKAGLHLNNAPKFTFAQTLIMIFYLFISNTTQTHDLVVISS